MNRKQILDCAEECVCQDRNLQYGPVEDNFATIADLWTAYWKATRRGEFNAVDVGIMMALLKAARIASGRDHADNFVDGAGYFVCAGEIATREDTTCG